VVKIFVNHSPLTLEIDINLWLTEHAKDITVNSISYAMKSTIDYFSALVYYVPSARKIAKETLRKY
jgi:hypothetical protein